jgi:hypothetical protein
MRRGAEALHAAFPWPDAAALTMPATLAARLQTVTAPSRMRLHTARNPGVESFSACSLANPLVYRNDLPQALLLECFEFRDIR